MVAYIVLKLFPSLMRLYPSHTHVTTFVTLCETQDIHLAGHVSCMMYVPCPISLSSLHVDCCIQKNGAVACQMDLLKGPVWSMDCMHLMCIHGCFRKALSTDTHTQLVPICLIISIIVYGILFGEKYLKIVYFISPQTIMAAETSMPEAYSL